MLFSSPLFVFGFLPVVLLGDILLAGRASRNVRYTFLLVCSLGFYGYWDPRYLVLPIVSIALNYAVGLRLSARPLSRSWLLPWGVALNLLALGYYKYTGFGVRTLGAVLGRSWPVPEIVLPIGISFFTFTQIAFLVDCARDEAREKHFLDYALFVVFFPHLIAGPIVHHTDLMPQLARDKRPPLRIRLASGLALFGVGLFKKSFLADGIAPFANSVFSAADAGGVVTFVDAWVGALAFSLQLYFDFSGYSDMACGLALLFGVQLPLNFDSPYQARSIVDFWRRWHMTLSRFLRDYVYVPLGGNRRGRARRYLNMMITMMVGGLWHGAGLNFLLWGTAHGVLLCINHGYRKLWSLAPTVVRERFAESRALSVAHWALTLAAVVAAWVPFRAETAGGARAILAAMARFDRIEIPAQLAGAVPALLSGIVHPSVSWVVSLRDPVDAIVRVVPLLALALLAPNANLLLSHHGPALDVEPSPHRLARVLAGQRPVLAVAAGLALGMGLVSMSEHEFLYFNF